MRESSLPATFSSSSARDSTNSTKTPTMKSMIVFAMLVCACVAASIPAGVAGPEAQAQVLRNDLDNIGVEGHRSAYETSNGIKQESEGHLKNIGTENEAYEVRGSFSYPGPDGVLYSLQYIANENGFQPQAAHLPVGPQA